MFKQLKSIKCENCEDIVSNSNYAQHITSCKLYWKHMEKTALGFKCNLCQFEKHDPKKSAIHQHLKTKHYNYIYFQNTDNEHNVECELCEKIVKYSNYSDHSTSCRIQKINKCVYCGVIIYHQGSFLSHFKACKMYNDCGFLEKIPKGYHCSMCSLDILKTKIAYHFKSKHSNYLGKGKDKYNGLS